MAKSIRCAGCRRQGEFGDGTNFEVRGRAGSRAVAKCLNCGMGLFVKPIFGRTEVIEPALWAQMEGRWNQAFPA